MKEDFIDFLIKHHDLKEDEAKWFWEYFSQANPTIKTVSEALKITYEDYSKHYEYFISSEKCNKKGKEIKDLYYNYWHRWKKYAEFYDEKGKYKTSLSDFEKFINKTNFTCCYCGVTHNQTKDYFSNLKIEHQNIRNRGNSLEVEHVINTKDILNGTQKLSEKDELLENLYLACYICNNAKSDFCSAKDFKPIAEGINIFWKKIRIVKIRDNKNLQIWETEPSFNNNPIIWDIDKI